MAVTPGLLTGGCQPRGSKIPAHCLTEPLARRHLPANRKLGFRHRTLQWLNAEDWSLAKHQHQLREAFQRGRLDPPLNPTDRVLAGAGSQREAALTQPLLCACLTENLAELQSGLTPHKVSEYRNAADQTMPIAMGSVFTARGPTYVLTRLARYTVTV
jgi:hypothetical protein